MRPAWGVVFFPLVLALLPLRALATPIVAEGEVQVVDGDLPRAREAAVTAALARAVGIVVARHVPGAGLDAPHPELEKQFLSNPLANVLRYAVVDEDVDRGRVRVTVEAEVDRQGLLARVREAGYAVVRLGARPRVLVYGSARQVPEGIEALRAVLDAEGFTTRGLAGEVEGPGDAAELAAAARDSGCHVAVAVNVRSREPQRVPSGPAAPGESTELAGSAAWAAPTPSRVFEVSVDVEGWLVEGRNAEVLGQAVASATEVGAEPVVLTARAAARAGREVAYRLLAQLEQSGWSPGDRVEAFDLRLSGLDAPPLVETIQGGLAGVTEVREVSLRELGYRSAVWRIVVADAGLGWEALLEAVRAPGGHLALERVLEADGPPWVTTVQAVWASP